jgi:hypothetical protein
LRVPTSTLIFLILNLPMHLEVNIFLTQ